MTTSQNQPQPEQPPRSNPLQDPRLSDDDRLDLRRRLVEQMYLQGNSARAISRQLTAEGYSVSNGTISADVRIIKERWQKDLDFDLEAIRSEELAKVNELEKRIWAGIVSCMGRGLHNAAIGYMNQMSRILERRARLLGLDAAPQQPGDSPERPFYMARADASQYDAMTPAQIDEELQKALQEAHDIINDQSSE